MITLLIFPFSNVAFAHPIGNFSINQFSRFEVEKNQIRIRQVLDIAEIPTFQESQSIDTDKNGALSQTELNAYAEKITPDYIGNLKLSANDFIVQLRAATKEIELQPGLANLPTLRIAWNLVGDLPDSNTLNRIRFENKNNVGRVGWNEIVVNPTAGINVFNSSVFGSDLSKELKEYPQDMLPLSQREADFSFNFGAIPANAKPLQNRNGKVTAPIQKDLFAELIRVEQITPGIALLGLLIAFGLGAAHALSPGHGKTVVGAYLVGSRGTFKHAAFLGLTVTITHTLGVFALGLITLFASNYIFPDRLMPFLNFVSGLLVFIIGVTLFKNRLSTLLGWKSKPLDHDHEDSHNDSAHPHPDDDFTHTHNGTTHSHKPPEAVTWGSLLTLGISGGLLPCPSALVLMLAAISQERIGYGLVLTLAFSFGLAATLMSVGLIFLYVGKIFENPSLSGNRIVKTLPVFSAFVIACVGAVICYSSIA
ncbi:MAG: high-affinity nickel-transporter [Pyrinomonadaceae bacterium]